MKKFRRNIPLQTAAAMLITMSLLCVSCDKPPQSFDDLKAAGIKAYTSQQFAEARGYLTRAVIMKSSDRDVLYFLAVCYQRDLILDSAFFYIRRAGILYSGDKEIAATLHSIAPQVQEWQAAIDAIQCLIASGDSPHQYYRELALFNKNLGNFYMAFINFEKAKITDSSNPQSFLELASAAVAAESISYALAILDTALEKFGETDEFLSNKAVLLSFQQRFAESEAILRKLVERRTDVPEFKLNLANALASQPIKGKMEEALSLYKMLEPSSDPSWKIDSLIASLMSELASMK